MATTTFGKRGAEATPRRAPFPRTAPATAPTPMAARTLESPQAAAEWTFRDNKLLADIPFLTAGLIVFLVLVFALERRLALDVGKDGALDVRTLIALGADSRNLVLGMGEWWRVGLAPLLHSSASHLFGNCFALFFVGIRLEPMIGRGWFLLIFVLSALGGEAASLACNPPDIPGVGASGAISGLIGALFIASFNPYADPQQRASLRRVSLFFGVPALLPLAYGASGEVNYFAHGGGALVGGVLGAVLWIVWSHDSPRPNHARRAGMMAMVGFAGSVVCAGFAANGYAAHIADAAQYIRPSELPKTTKVGAKHSADLLARYPKDPRAHLIRAFYLVEQHHFGEAERELRASMSLAASDVAGGTAVRSHAQAVLAVILLDQDRRVEAKTLAADGCSRTARDPLRQALAKVKLCD